MQHLMRKHKKIILTVVIVLVGGAFVLSGAVVDWSSFGKGAKGENVIATVGQEPIMKHELVQALSDEVERRGRYGESPTYAELALDGTAEQALRSLIDQRLLQLKARDLAFDAPREYLVEQLKKDPTFQDDSGEFDPALFNQWVEMSKKEKRDWNAIYNMVREQTGYQLLMKEIAAQARVLDAQVEEEFEDRFTKIKVKYAAIEPPIEPTDEEIQAQYDKDPEAYALPAERTANFIAIPLTPPQPEIVGELLERARAGEDFEALAKGHTEMQMEKEKGGLLDWRAIPETPLAHEKPYYGLAVGEVSDPVYGMGGYFIYKVEEERQNEETQQREIRGRRIFIRATLEQEEREAREARVEELLAKAKETALETAAQDAGLPVQTSGSFTKDSSSIDNIPANDTYYVKQALTKVDDNAFAPVIKGRENLYVAKVASYKAPVIRPLAEVRDKVREDTIAAIRRSDEYRQKVADIAQEIAEKADSFDDIRKLHPELTVTVQESPEFSVGDYDYSAMQVYWQPNQVYQAVGHKEPGAFGGPVMDFMGKAYFVELVSKTPPGEDVRAEKWETESDRIREQLASAAEQAVLVDYVSDLRQRMLAEGEVPLRRNDALIAEVLGIADTEAPPAEEQAEPAQGQDAS